MDIDLEIYRNESVTILRRDGVGKSIPLYHLNGTLIRDEGHYLMLPWGKKSEGYPETGRFGFPKSRGSALLPDGHR